METNKETIKRVATELFQRYKDTQPKVWYMQSIGGTPFRIRWVQGKGKPRLEIVVEHEDGQYMVKASGRNETLHYTEDRFTPDNLYNDTLTWLSDTTASRVGHI
jgi:hypothetical protein